MSTPETCPRCLVRFARAMDNAARLNYATNWRRCTEWCSRSFIDCSSGDPPCFEQPDDETQPEECCAACQERIRLWPDRDSARRELRNARRAVLKLARRLAKDKAQ